MPTLNRNNSNWSAEERRKINENWELLEGIANSTASGNNGLKQDVDNLSARVSNNTQRTTTAIQLANQSNLKATDSLTLSNNANANSDTALRLANESKTTADTVQEQFNQIVAEAGSNNPEVVASRSDATTGETFESLPIRLDRQHGQLTTHTDGWVSVKDFGAIGNNSRDNTADIRAAINYAIENGLKLWFPASRFGYKTTDTIHINGNIDVIMDSPIVYHGDSDKVVLRYGDTSMTIRNRSSKLQAYKYYPFADYNVDWSNPSNVAVQLVNIVESSIDVVEASNCAVGLQIVGDTKAFSYSNISVGRLYNNREAINLLATGAGGYVTELKITGGRLGHFSATNLTQSRYGVTTKKLSEHVFDGIIFDKQSIELFHTRLTDGAEGVPFLIEDADTCQFTDFRSESNSPFALARLTRCYQVDFLPLKVVGGSSALVELEVASKGPNTNRNLALSDEVEVLSFDNLASNVSYSYRSYGTPRIMLRGLFSLFLSTAAFSMSANVRDFTQYINPNNPIKNNGIEFTDNINIQNIAVGFDTSEHKLIKLRKNGNVRVGILCFDSQGNYIVPTATSNHVVGGFLEFSSAYLGGLYLQPDTGVVAYKDLIFRVSEDVHKIIVFIGKSSRRSDFSSFSVSAVYVDTPNRFTTLRTWFPINVFKLPFPQEPNIPNFREHLAGEIVWNSLPTTGGYVGWVCTVGGNPGTWVGFGQI